MIKLIRKFISNSNQCLESFDEKIADAKIRQSKEYEERERKLLQEFNQKNNTDLTSLEQLESYLKTQELLFEMKQFNEFLKNR